MKFLGRWWRLRLRRRDARLLWPEVEYQCRGLSQEALGDG